VAVIEVSDLWKSYRIYRQRTHSLKETILARRAEYDQFWALRGVSFSVDKGEMLGVIGANGSGKSTLLKCVARILAPNAGSVSVDGKISTLIELGTGFHAELSGRDNVYLSGSILGLSREQIDSRFDDIVRFAGVEEFLDTPIKNYSSGMQARLGFAVAINVDPEILLIDEVLAVGDQAFQMRCYERIHDLRRQNKTVVFVSHSLAAVRELCSRVIWLEHGRISAIGDAQSVVHEYMDFVRREEAGGQSEVLTGGDRWGSGEVSITDVELLDLEGSALPLLTTGNGVRLRMHYEASEPIDEVVFGITVESVDSASVVTGLTTMTHQRSFDLEAGHGVVDYVVPRLPLWQGTYLLTVTAQDLSARRVYDRRERQLQFLVVPGDLGHGEGALFLPGDWECKRGASVR
jgi:ABC-type polysaccharide/polyol phosphate transport system ATPase subunit